MQQIGHSSRNLIQKPITLPTQEAFEETSEEDDNPDYDIVHHVSENPLIQTEGSTVYLQSPTFGDRVRIANPVCKFGSSVNAMKDLRHVEAQI